MVLRGLLLLGMMLVIVTMVWLVLMRSQDDPRRPDASHPEMVALVVPIPSSTSFPGQLNWGALALLSERLPSSPGWQVRYNAVLALARRGSTAIPLDVVAEMLDENQQMRNFQVKLTDSALVADEYAARTMVLIALKATVEWHEHKDALKTVGENNPQLERVYAAIDRLTRSQNEAVRLEAERVKKLVSG